MPTAVPDEPAESREESTREPVNVAVELRLDEKQKSELTRMLGAINERDPGRKSRPSAS